jgi:hypothetical protein
MLRAAPARMRLLIFMATSFGAEERKADARRSSG